MGDLLGVEGDYCARHDDRDDEDSDNCPAPLHPAAYAPRGKCKTPGARGSHAARRAASLAHEWPGPSSSQAAGSEVCTRPGGSSGGCRDTAPGSCSSPTPTTCST